MIGSLAVGIAAALLMWFASGFHRTPYENYVYLADAFRHHRVWVDWPGPRVDALLYAGRYYVIEAPFPALLVFPFVAFAGGPFFNQEIVAAVLGGVAVFAAWEVARRLGVKPATRALLVGFFAFGTDLFWCATLGDVWFLAHVSAVAFTMLALMELVGRKRGWLVALFAACAFESRFDFVLVLPVYAALLCVDRAPRERLRALAGFVAVLVPVACAWVWYNEARWSLWYDVGYAAWYHQDDMGETTGSPFKLKYLPYELWSMFWQFPAVYRTWPYLVPTGSGVAITWTSPALVLAFFARGPRALTIAMWTATVACLVPNLVYYVNGGSQFGMRHALDFEPFLFVLMCLGSLEGLGAAGIFLCTWSIAVGVWGVWFWRTFYRPGFKGF